MLLFVFYDRFPGRRRARKMALFCRHLSGSNGPLQKRDTNKCAPLILSHLLSISIFRGPPENTAREKNISILSHILESKFIYWGNSIKKKRMKTAFDIGLVMSLAGMCCLLLSVVQCENQCDAEILSIPFDESEYKLYHVKGPNADFYIDADGVGKNDIVKDVLSKGVYWEEHIGKLVGKYAKEGSVAVDVGAHIGLHTVTMSRAVGPNGIVHAFEPQRRLCAEHWKNMELNSCNNVFLHRKALGDRPRKMQVGMPVPLYGDAARTLVEFEEGDTERGDEVDMITLDSLNLDNVSLIKADVEFYEYAVFQGAKETIQRCRPILLFEYLGGYEDPKDKDIKIPKDIEVNSKKARELVASYGYIAREINFDGANYIGIPIEKIAQIEEEANRG